MYRKILGICMALAALAVVLPASASAITLTDTSAGVTTSVGTGKLIEAVSEGNSEFVGGGVTVTCNENALTGEVVNHGPNVIEATITHGEFQSNLNASGTECKSGLGPTNVTLPLTNGTIEPKVHWCIKTVEGKDTFEFFGKNCGAAGEGSLTFIFHFTTIFGTVTCGYVRNEKVVGTFTTETAGHNPSTLALTGEPKFTKHLGGGTCPESGILKSLNFFLYTDTSTTGWDDAASTTDPVWISDKV